MSKKLVKLYGDFEINDFINAIRDEYDNFLFTWKDQDYMVDREKNPEGGMWWMFVDAFEDLTIPNPRVLSGKYSTLDELMNAREMDGRSFVERYDEIKTCDEMYIVDDSQDIL